MTTQPPDNRFAGGDDAPPFTPGDELDMLLRDWHNTNREHAAAGRDRLLAALRAEDAATADTSPAPAALEFKPVAAPIASPSHPASPATWRFNRLAPLALAALVALAVVAPYMLPPGNSGTSLALAENLVMCPEGGSLEAYDAAGNTLGPCILKHTDVAAEITGHIARVTLTQTFHNPHKDKVEAVYTFPLSHTGAVDRMSMAIGDRVIVGEVKERDLARELYEAARDQGLVAALTEQERPNIFTQSVANIEPGAQIAVTLSYVEFVNEKDGEFSFAFPTVVGPRYVPGEPITTDKAPGLPNGLVPRRGVVLLAPASLRFTDRGPGFSRSERTPDINILAAAIKGATPIEQPAAISNDMRWLALEVHYANGQIEQGVYYDIRPAIGHIGGRWFTLADAAAPRIDDDPAPRDAPPPINTPAESRIAAEPGAPFAQGTDQVPDAARVTPMPVPPGTRAGHDLSITVTINTGGPGILGIQSPLHNTVRADTSTNDRGLPRKSVITLKKSATIPNRDFVLNWRQSAELVTDQTFTHTGKHGNFFGLMLRPPARVDDTQAVPRELIFVVDTSGSMRGFPIEKSKEVMERALAAVRPGDTFNVITFAGATSVLWPAPRSVNHANLAEARALIASQSGSGGTEMMTAINAALAQSPADDDRPARPLRIVMFLTDGHVANDGAIISAVKANRGTTRVFSFGIGNSVNRYLLDSIAQEGGGTSEYVLLESDAASAIERFTRRTQTPVLTNISVEFSDNLSVLDFLPPLTNIPDLFDEQPVTILGRYTAPGAGTLIIRGNTAAGPWERTLTLSLPANQPEHDTIATMWARAKIDQIKSSDLHAAQNDMLPAEQRAAIVQLGEQFGIMSEYTSFLAIDKLRVTIAGKPRLVNVPIELPAGTSYEGFFAVPDRSGDETWNTRAAGDLQQVPEIDRIVLQPAMDADDKLDAGESRREREMSLSSNLASGVPAQPTLTPGDSAAKRAAPPPPAPPAPAAAPAPAMEPASAARDRERPDQMRKEEGKSGGAPSTVAGRPSAPTAPQSAAEGAASRGLHPQARAASPVTPPNMQPSGGNTPLPQIRQAEQAGRGGTRGDSRSGDKLTDAFALSKIDERSERSQVRRDGGYSLGIQFYRAQNESESLGKNVNVLVNDSSRQQQMNLFVPREQVVLRVEQLAQQNQTDSARILACDLALAAPDYPVAVELCQTLNELKVVPEIQTKQVAALAARARQDLQDLGRAAELRRKLDERLWVYAIGEGPMPSAQRTNDQVSGCDNLTPLEAHQVAKAANIVLHDLVSEKRSTDTSEAVGALVTVLVTDTSEATLKLLQNAGLKVEDTNHKSQVVVGVIPLGKLHDLALLECVRRVEPMPAE